MMIQAKITKFTEEFASRCDMMQCIALLRDSHWTCDITFHTFQDYENLIKFCLLCKCIGLNVELMLFILGYNLVKSHIHLPYSRQMASNIIPYLTHACRI